MINEQPTQQEARPTTPEPSSGRLQVLATDLTGAVVALALFAQVDHFHATFQMAAILILTVVVFVGLVTIGRVSTLNRENFQLVAGMNRLRRAYLEAYPDVEPYFVAGSHDDLRGFQLTMSLPGFAKPSSPMTMMTQGLQTLPAMLGVIVSLVAGLLGALVATSFGASTATSVVVAAVIFFLLNVLLAAVSQRAFFKFVRTMPARFPSSSGPPA